MSVKKLHKIVCVCYDKYIIDMNKFLFFYHILSFIFPYLINNYNW